MRQDNNKNTMQKSDKSETIEIVTLKHEEETTFEVSTQNEATKKKIQETAYEEPVSKKTVFKKTKSRSQRQK